MLTYMIATNQKVVKSQEKESNDRQLVHQQHFQNHLQCSQFFIDAAMQLIRRCYPVHELLLMANISATV